MPLEVSQRLLEKRYGGDADKKDIHESDLNYLTQCRTAALYAAEKLGWIVLPCSENGEALAPDVIHNQLFELYNSMWE